MLSAAPGSCRGLGGGGGGGRGGGGAGGEGEGKGEGKRGLKSWGLEATGT